MDDDDRGDIEAWKGVPYSCVFSLEDEEGNPAVLTGLTAKLRIWVGSPDDPPGGTPALDLTSAGGDLTLDSPDPGDISLALTAAKSASLASLDYWYELVLYSGGALHDKPQWGYWKHKPTGDSP